jgi:O-antigen/teichoic acid export membrane protein
MRSLLTRAFRGQFLIEIVVRARGLLILPIATRALGPEGYGQIAFAAALTGLVGVIATMGMPAAMSRFLPGKEDDEQRADIFWPGFAASAATAALFALVTIALFAVAPLAPADMPFVLIVLAAVNVISQELKIFLFSYWRFTLQLTGYYRFLAIDAVAVGAAQLVVLTVLDGGPVAIVGATVAIDFILLLAALTILGRRLPWRRPEWAVLAPLYKFGLPLGATGLLNWANNTADRFFIQGFVGTAALGVYSVGYNLGFIAVSLVATPVFAILSSVMFRAWDQGDREGAQRLLARFSSVLAVGCIPPILSLHFFGQPVIDLLAGPGFGEAHDIVLLVSAGYLLMFLGDLYGYPLWLHNRQYLYSLAMVGSVAVNIAGNAVLVPRLDAVGSAVATTASLGLLAVTLVVINVRNGYARPPIYRPILTAAVGAAIFGALSLAWPHDANVAHTAAFSVCATLLFLLACYPLRLLPIDPRELLRRRHAEAATVPP